MNINKISRKEFDAICELTPVQFSALPEEIQESEYIFRKLVNRKRENAFAYATEKIKNSKEMFRWIATNEPNCFEFASNEILEDINFMAEAFHLNQQTIKFMGPQLRKNLVLAKFVESWNLFYLKYFERSVWVDIMINRLQSIGYHAVPVWCLRDNEFFIKALAIEQKIINKLSKEQKTDANFAAEVIKEFPSLAFHFDLTQSGLAYDISGYNPITCLDDQGYDRNWINGKTGKLISFFSEPTIEFKTKEDYINLINKYLIGGYSQIGFAKENNLNLKEFKKLCQFASQKDQEIGRRIKELKKQINQKFLMTRYTLVENILSEKKSILDPKCYIECQTTFNELVKLSSRNRAELLIKLLEKKFNQDDLVSINIRTRRKSLQLAQEMCQNLINFCSNNTTYNANLNRLHEIKRKLVMYEKRFNFKSYMNTKPAFGKVVNGEVVDIKVTPETVGKAFQLLKENYRHICYLTIVDAVQKVALS